MGTEISGTGTIVGMGISELKMELMVGSAKVGTEAGIVFAGSHVVLEVLWDAAPAGRTKAALIRAPTSAKARILSIASPGLSKLDRKSD